MEELTGLDARFLYSETPNAHMHTLKIVVFDISGRAGPITPEDLVEGLSARLDRLALLRRRVVPIPFGIGHPVWIEDPDFDLSRHVRWVTAPPPGGDRELAAVVADIAAARLPRDRPLWDLTVVDGLGDRLAFVVKLHHALADGGAAVALFENVFATEDDLALLERSVPEPVPSGRVLVREAVRSRARTIRGIPGFARRNLAGLRSARRAARESDVKLAAPFSGPRTSLNAALGADRTFAMTSLPLDDLLAVKRAAGVTVNDVFLAVCGGGLRRYLARRGELPAHGLLAGVPLATRAGVRHLRGNHVDNLMLPIGSDTEDPAVRLRLVHEASVSARRVREAMGVDLFERRAQLTPPVLYPLGLRLWARTRLADRTRPPINLIASNVRGPAALPDIDGVTATALYSVGPILEGIGLNITAWSFRDRLEVSVLGCRATLPDPWELVEDLNAAAEELVAVRR